MIDRCCIGGKAHGEFTCVMIPSAQIDKINEPISLSWTHTNAFGFNVHVCAASEQQIDKNRMLPLRGVHIDGLPPEVINFQGRLAGFVGDSNCWRCNKVERRT